MALNIDLHFLLPYHLLLDSLSGATSITLGFNTPNSAHDVITKLSEVTALQKFCPKISNHLIGGTPMNTDLLHVDSITHKEVPNVDMPSALAA